MSTALNPALNFNGISDLLRQAMAGCEQSAEDLYLMLRRPLLRVIRPIIEPSIRRLMDSDDFLCETFAAVFTRHICEDVLQSPGSLWRYFAAIAKNKVLDANRRFLIYERRDLAREVSIDELTADDQPLARDPAPDESVMLDELVEEWIKAVFKQQPLVNQYVIQFWMSGSNVSEIAKRTDVSIRTIQRILKRAEQSLRNSWLN